MLFILFKFDFSMKCNLANTNMCNSDDKCNWN